MEVGSHNICPFVFGLFYLAHVSEVYPLLAHGSEFHSSLRLLGPTERLYHMVLIRLSIDGSWGCFYLLAPVPLLDITVWGIRAQTWKPDAHPFTYYPGKLLTPEFAHL